MRIIASIFFSLLILSCEELDDANTKRLSEINQHNKDGTVQYWKYSYDNLGRIHTVTNYVDGGQHNVATISYDENVIFISNQVKSDAQYEQTTEIRLMLDENDQVQKRIEFTDKVPVSNSYIHVKVYDTLLSEYDNTGFLERTSRKRLTLSGVYERNRAVYDLVYVIEDGNLVSFDEYNESINELKGYLTDEFGVVSRYTTERVVEFTYTDAYPNKELDLKNSIILNEFTPLYMMPPVNGMYKNLPNSVSIKSGIIKDENDQVLVNLGGLIAKVERTYKEGKLSSDKIVDGNLQIKQINYLYK